MTKQRKQTLTEVEREKKVDWIPFFIGGFLLILLFIQAWKVGDLKQENLALKEQCISFNINYRCYGMEGWKTFNSTYDNYFDYSEQKVHFEKLFESINCEVLP